MKNKIIIEGFWNIGKTSLAHSLIKDYGHFFISEPNHLDHNIPQKMINSWYLKEHSKNFKIFFKKRLALSERSIVSSAAFLHATNLRIDHRLLNDFKTKYEKEKSLIIFLYADLKTVKSLSIGVADQNLRRLLKKDSFIKRYENFYRNILPFTYNIVPIFVNIGSISARKTVGEIKRQIVKIVNNNRLAQVSIFCYKIQKEPIFLLLKRSKQKGGFWQGVTGGVKINETIKEALSREIHEELGLGLRPGDVLEIGHSFSFLGSEGYELNEYVFGYRLKRDDKIFLSGEHSESKFVTLNEALRLLKYKTNKVAIKKVAINIKKHKD